MSSLKDCVDQKHFFGYDNNVLLFSVENEIELDRLKDIVNVPHEQVQNTLVFKHTNVIDLLFQVPDSVAYKKLIYILTRKDELPKCSFLLVDEQAHRPCKARPSDAGYDITIIKEFKTLTSNTKLYDTGVKVIPAIGYYTELVPRSSLSKSGYMLANSVGILDASYTGNILVALTKIDPNIPDLTLPFKCCQLIFKEQIFVNLEEIQTKCDTTRNDGGFGSTDKLS
jgi:deoxyuridine 5'-triphosphate nucleotidohydrolase